MIEWRGQPGSATMPPAQDYESVAADLERRIRAGEFPPGARLPSRRELQALYGKSGSVIDKAMMILKFRGLTETLPGVAVFVRDPLPPSS